MISRYSPQKCPYTFASTPTDDCDRFLRFGQCCEVGRFSCPGNEFYGEIQVCTAHSGKMAYIGVRRVIRDN